MAALLAAAVEETALDDFGDEGFSAGFEHYVDGVNAETNLNQVGLEAQRGFIQKTLVNRLRYREDLKRHPEILDEPVEDPIIVLGLPRTGTTKLSRMLSADPGVQSLLYWRSLNPAPFPGAAEGEPDPRIEFAKQQEEAMARAFPGFWAHHAMMAEEAEEDLILHDYCFQAPSLGVRTATYTTYLPWLASHDPELRACHRYERGLLQYLQWQDGGARGRPWVLKNVVSLGYVPTLLEVFPEATIVECHRDPRVSFASTLKLFELAREAFTMSADFDLTEHGWVFLRTYAEQARRNVDQRKELGASPAIIDVHYAEIVDDPHAVIARIHELRGSELSLEAERLISEWEARNPQHRFGRVQYSLDRYGLDVAAVEEAFGTYIEHFEIPRETTA